MMENMVFDWVRLGVELVLGGGLFVLYRNFKTMRHDVEKAKQEAKAQELENEEKAMDTMQTYIVKPIKREINGVRREIARLRRAIDKVKDCAYSDECPVSNELRRSETFGAAEPYGDRFDTTDDER